MIFTSQPPRYNAAMSLPAGFEAIDYLAVGHITIDITDQGPRLGGSAAYAALTAQALGLRAGIVTAWAEELPLGVLEDIPVFNIGAQQSSTFENIYTEKGRTQWYQGQAPFLEFHHIPEAWRTPRILHLAPVAREVSPRILKYFEDCTLGVTPQGWLREWDAVGNVAVADWEESGHVLGRADAAVISLDDVAGDQTRVDRMAANCPLLVVTDGARGTMLYAHGNEQLIDSLPAEVLDPTGAGDIFAAAFFVRLHLGGSPLEAAQFAAQLAARSTQRAGLAGVPNKDEIYDLMAEAL